MLLLLALVFVSSEVKDLVSIDVFNMSRSNSSQGGGFVISSSSNGFVNGSSLNSNTVGSSGISVLNISSGVINVNVSFFRNGTHGNYVNVTFGWLLSKSNNTVMLNTTIFNNTLNQSAFNYSFNSGLLGWVVYNLTIQLENVSGLRIINFSFGFDVLIDRTAPPIQSFGLNQTNNFNITGSRKFVINASVNDSFYTQSVKIGVRNSFNNLTEFNLTTTRNFTLFAAELDSAFLTDGLYTLVVYATDSLGNNNVSVNNVTFVVDRTGPNVTNIFLGNWTNGAYIGGDVAALGANTIVNITVEANDSLTQTNGQASNNYLAQVFFNISNSTGQINYTRAIQNGSLWNASVVLNLSDSRYFPDGVYSIIVYANDSLNNYNRTQNLTFTIDRVAPSVSVSCTTNPTVGQTATCTCTVSDATAGLVTGYGFPGGKLTESTTASSVGSFTSSNCGATDNAGNSRTATGSWTVVASSSGGSGGGGGGGSGGGVSKGVVDQFEKKVWTSINKGEMASIAVKDGQIGVTGVEFTTSKATYGVTLQVEKVSTLPINVKAVDKKVYKYVKITESNVDKALDGVAKVNFKVTKDWLKENGLQKENVIMYRYVGTQWVGLKTTVGEDDGTYQTYVAETPGFSYFAIGQGEAVVAPAVVKGEKKVESAKSEVKSEPVTEAAKAAAVTPATSTEKTLDATEAATKTTSGSGSWWVWIVFVLAIGVVIVVVYWWVKK